MSFLIASTLSLVAAEAAAPTPVYPQPEAFLPLANTEIVMFGYFSCVGEYGWHLISGTALPLEDALSKSVADCEVVRTAAFENLIRDGSPFRSVLEEKTDKPLTDAKIRKAAEITLDTFAQHWVEGVRANAESFRASEDYDPQAYMARYRAEVKAGTFNWMPDE